MAKRSTYIFDDTKKETKRNNGTTPVVKRSVTTSLMHESGNGKKDGMIWLSRISKTQRLRDQMRNGSKDWMRYYQWFEGEQWQERGMVFHDLASDNARNTATVNTTGSIALSYMPFLLHGEIKFKLKPRKGKDVTSSDIQQSILNYEWGERGMTEEAKNIIADVVIIGHGIGKTGYVVELDEARKISDGEINYKDYIRKDASFIERVNPLCFLFDMAAKDGTLQTARWVAECFFVPYDDVLANSSYNQDVLEQIHSGTYPIALRNGFEGVGSDDPIWGQKLDTNIPEDRLVCLWEIWDKKFKKRYIYPEGVSLPLLEEDWPYDYLDGFPYVKIDFIKVPNRPYGMGIMRQAEDQQMQLNRIRTAQFLHIRSHKRVFQAFVDGIQDSTNLDDFADLPDGAVIPVTVPEAIKPVADAPMSQDFQIVESRIQADIEALTGADALLQGRPLPSRTTAGEVSARTNILRLKADDRISAVENGVIELARQVLHHLKANRTIPDIIEVVGLQGTEWKEYTSEDIQADVDVDVDYFSAPRFDPAVDRQQRLQILQLGIQAIPALKESGSDQQIDIVQLLNWVLESFDDKGITRFFKPALVTQPTLEETEVTQQTTQIPNEPNPNQPAGLNAEDLLQGIIGGGVGQAGELPEV